jgi:hypothetical protein
MRRIAVVGGFPPTTDLFRLARVSLLLWSSFGPNILYDRKDDHKEDSEESGDTAEGDCGTRPKYLRVLTYPKFKLTKREI